MFIAINQFFILLTVINKTLMKILIFKSAHLSSWLLKFNHDNMILSLFTHYQSAMHYFSAPKWCY